MFAKLIIFFLIVFVTALKCETNATLECQTDDVQNFIDSGEKKMAELEKQYYESTNGSNFDEQKLRAFMEKELKWKNQVDDRKTQLEYCLRNSYNLTAEERAKLEKAINLLTTAYFKVFLALHLNIHVVFDHVQLVLLTVLDIIKCNDTELIEKKFNRTLTSIKAVFEDIKVQGGRSCDDVKAMIVAAKKAKNQAMVEALQYMHINDSILHILSELSLQIANIENLIRCIDRLKVKTLDSSITALLVYFQKKFEAQVIEIKVTFEEVKQRIKTDL